MKVIFLILCYLIITTSTLSQNNHDYSDKYEFKIGGELNRIVPSLGFGKNFYFSKYISISPEFLMVGLPIASGTYRFNFNINSDIQTSIQGGAGITFGMSITMIGIIGINISYKINNDIYLFIEPRLYYFPKKFVSINNLIWGIEKINERNPFVVTLGIGF